ncbi:hypothetical protein GALMADRAFT_1210143 [Galerina marginata CBS 339.88]|uniref:Uncharacterized protein n=1 Tax=Galerina marginata (strain CBS 339.88) TaxID=685588 RepID=A0A067S5F8_GALM3|nr:hypothetical protein GALMADRAFT_1210143 [Galerina marginata CBS 339.88]
MCRAFFSPPISLRRIRLIFSPGFRSRFSCFCIASRGDAALCSSSSFESESSSSSRGVLLAPIKEKKKHPLSITSHQPQNPLPHLTRRLDDLIYDIQHLRLPHLLRRLTPLMLAPVIRGCLSDGSYDLGSNLDSH